jgi:hypothetical protein
MQTGVEQGSIVRVIKYRVGLMGQAAGIGEVRNGYESLADKPE